MDPDVQQRKRIIHLRLKHHSLLPYVYFFNRGFHSASLLCTHEVYGDVRPSVFPFVLEAVVVVVVLECAARFFCWRRQRERKVLAIVRPRHCKLRSSLYLGWFMSLHLKSPLWPSLKRVLWPWWTQHAQGKRLACWMLTSMAVWCHLWPRPPFDDFNNTRRRLQDMQMKLYRYNAVKKPCLKASGIMTLRWRLSAHRMTAWNRCLKTSCCSLCREVTARDV